MTYSIGWGNRHCHKTIYVYFPNDINVRRITESWDDDWDHYNGRDETEDTVMFLSLPKEIQDQLHRLYAYDYNRTELMCFLCDRPIPTHGYSSESALLEDLNRATKYWGEVETIEYIGMKLKKKQLISIIHEWIGKTSLSGFNKSDLINVINRKITFINEAKSQYRKEAEYVKIMGSLLANYSFYKPKRNEWID